MFANYGFARLVVISCSIQLLSHSLRSVKKEIIKYLGLLASSSVHTTLFSRLCCIQRLRHCFGSV